MAIGQRVLNICRNRHRLTPANLVELEHAVIMFVTIRVKADARQRDVNTGKRNSARFSDGF